ncbi:MAG TPA: YitT family protein, partial [Acholeplasmataceae bacterium]|nr:YitT family protein [Acholeplasmataceae bacterium]
MFRLSNAKKRNIRVIAGMVSGSVIYCLGVVWFLDLGQFYAGGVTGFSQLLSNFLALFDIRISKSIFIALLNIP